MTMPNFLIIGAASSGTTSLYWYLKQHPQVFMSPVKETNFFSWADKGIDFTPETGEYKRRHAKAYNPSQDTYYSLEEYQELFRNASDEIAIGEVSPSYLYFSLGTAKRIHQLIPNAKLIAILRDPADRAYSNYKRCVCKGEEPIADFDKALLQESIRMQNNWHPKYFYKFAGFYYEQIKMYFEFFNRNQLLICLHDDLKRDTSSLMQSIYSFLDVDKISLPNKDIKYNSSYVPRHKVIQDMLIPKNNNLLKKIIRQIMPHEARKRLSTNLKEWNEKERKISANMRTQLIQEYRDDILRLQDLIQRDLSKWLQ